MQVQNLQKKNRSFVIGFAPNDRIYFYKNRNALLLLQGPQFLIEPTQNKIKLVTGYIKLLKIANINFKIDCTYRVGEFFCEQLYPSEIKLDQSISTVVIALQ